MKKKLLFVLSLGLIASVLSGCGSNQDQAQDVSEITIYSGRSEEYFTPFTEWEEKTGIKVNIRYGDSAELAAQILEEGANSPADLFLSQDAGSLGAVSQAALFATLPENIGTDIRSKFIAADRSWIGVTGRARVFAYNPAKISTLPQSVTNLTDAKYRNQVGIAPSNASFQAFISGLINAKGEAAAQKWLNDMKANGVKIYPKNSAIVEAIDKGEISIGLVNHYYVWEVTESLGREINAKIGFFAPGDIGNMVNVSGIGVLASSAKQSAAQDFINFLTTAAVQKEFVAQSFEYSLLPNAVPPVGLLTLEAIGAPAVDLAALKDVQRTQDLLIKVGLL